MAEPATYNIEVVAGDDYQITVKLLEDGDPIDTSGYTFTAQVRDNYLPDGNLVASFGVSAVTGGATLSLTSAQTEAFVNYNKLYWDVQSASPKIRTWLSGKVNVTAEVTE